MARHVMKQRIAAATAGLLTSVALLVGGIAEPFTARADAVAYLVNVTVRPGYDFPNADAAVGYGQLICDKVAAGRSYRDLIGDTLTDFATTDEFQASYLITQAVGELCPALIWHLRNSAAQPVGGTP